MSKNEKQKTRVVNIRYEEFDVYIGRPSKWGNIYKGNRTEAIKKYKLWILNQKNLLDDLHELKGKRLGCFCHPLPCHGDILVELIEEYIEQNILLF